MEENKKNKDQDINNDNIRENDPESGAPLGGALGDPEQAGAGANYGDANDEENRPKAATNGDTRAHRPNPGRSDSEKENL